MRCPIQGAAGGWVMLGLVLRWFPLCEFSLFDTPWGYFSGSLGSWCQCSQSKGSRLDLMSEMKIRTWFVMALNEIKTNTTKGEIKDESQTNGSYKNSI